MQRHDSRQHSAGTLHDLMRLRRLVYQCQFMMNKADRIIYGTPLVQTLMTAIMWFTRSYESREPSEKLSAADEAAMWFSVFRMDLTAAVEENIIKFPKRKPRPAFLPDGSIGVPPEETVSSRKIEIVELVAKIDTGMCRWRSSLAKGRTAPDAPRQGQGCGG